MSPLKLYMTISKINIFISLLILAPIGFGCQNNKNGKSIISATIREQLFDPLLCDGFDFPLGNVNGKGPYTSLKDKKTYPGFYIATHTGEKYPLGIHTGEDWNGLGGGNTDEGLPVHSTAKGIVIAAGNYEKPWGNIVMIEHRYSENGQVKKVFSLYAHLLKIAVHEGDVVSRRKTIGSVGTGNGSFPHIYILRFGKDLWKVMQLIIGLVLMEKIKTGY